MRSLATSDNLANVLLGMHGLTKSEHMANQPVTPVTAAQLRWLLRYPPAAEGDSEDGGCQQNSTYSNIEMELLLRALSTTGLIEGSDETGYLLSESGRMAAAKMQKSRESRESRESQESQESREISTT